MGVVGADTGADTGACAASGAGEGDVDGEPSDASELISELLDVPGADSPGVSGDADTSPSTSTSISCGPAVAAATLPARVRERFSRPSRPSASSPPDALDSSNVRFGERYCARAPEVPACRCGWRACTRSSPDDADDGGADSGWRCGVPTTAGAGAGDAWEKGDAAREVGSGISSGSCTEASVVSDAAALFGGTFSLTFSASRAFLSVALDSRSRFFSRSRSFRASFARSSGGGGASVCAGVSWIFGSPVCGPRRLRIDEKCSQSWYLHRYESLLQ